MEKLDRSVWAAGYCFVAYGRRIGVRASRPEGLGRLLPSLLPRWRGTSEPEVDVLFSMVGGGAVVRSNVRHYHLLYQDAGRLARTMDANEAVAAFDQKLHLWIAENARDRVFVHAGAVGWKGRAILIPGRSFAGKSTLVAALVRAGATYYSDEYAVLDRDGRVHPYARPLSLRATGEAPPRLMTADDLGGQTATASLPVGLVADTSYQPGARWRPRRRSSGQGLMTLLANTVAARSRPKPVLRTLGAVVNSATVLRGRRGDAEETAIRLLEALD